MATKSTRNTGNEPAEGLDPGGTRSTRNHAPDAASIGHEVESGDRNPRRNSKVTPAVDDGASDSGPSEH
jgi:hypothetical protein